MVCSGTVFRTKGRSVKAAAITDDGTTAAVPRATAWWWPRGGEVVAATTWRELRVEAAQWALDRVLQDAQF